METQASENRPSDKVRIRSGTWEGTRGVIVSSAPDRLQVELRGGDRLTFRPDEVTNYSRAARRAWQAMPKRAGRPRSSNGPKQMVSLRIEPRLWRLLAAAVDLGLIRSREQAINEWLQQHVAELFTGVTDPPNDRGDVSQPISLAAYSTAKRRVARR